MPRSRTRIRTIEEVESLFADWRRNRQGRSSAIPDELWAAAGELARRDGVSRIAAALHLDGGKLKRRMTEGTTAKKTAPPRFVELFTPGMIATAEYTIELEGRQGKLRIHCKGTSAAEMVAWSRTLWDAVS